MEPYAYDPNRPWSLDRAQLAYPAYNPGASTTAPATLDADTMNPYIAGAGLGLKAVGTALDIYGGIEAKKDADRAAGDAREAYMANLLAAAREARRRELDANLDRAGGLSMAAYAASARDAASMTPYNHAIGR